MADKEIAPEDRSSASLKRHQVIWARHKDKYNARRRVANLSPEALERSRQVARERYERERGKVKDEEHKERGRAAALRYYHKHKNDPGYKEKKVAANRKCAQAKPAQYAEYTRRWRAKNPDHAPQKDKEWRANNRAKYNATKSAWRKKNPDKTSAALRQWRRANPDYATLKWQNDPVYRVKCGLRVRWRIALGKARAAKVAGLDELLGCTIDQLREHIEAKFRDGMCWANYGLWHMDHIRPLASFNLLDETEQRLACHYTNLQPLWSVDNLRKGAKDSIGSRRT